MQYRGITRRPDNMTCPDGDLELAINVVNEDGNIRPLELPTLKGSLKGDEIIMYVHKDNYIVVSATSVGWRKVDNLDSCGDLFQYDPNEAKVLSVSSLGNTLIIATTTRLLYAIIDDDGYKFLGDKPPYLDMRFTLNSELIAPGDPFTLWDGGDLDVTAVVDRNIFSFKYYNRNEDNETINNHVNEITSITLAQVNKFIAEKVTAKNKFIYPFFIRYAYRLFDGSLSHHSAPILMMPFDDCSPVVYATEFYPKASSNVPLNFYDKLTLKAKVSAVVSDILYQIKEIPSTLSDWSDIIKSVDIFISSPIYTYDQSGKVYGWSYQGQSFNKFNAGTYCKLPSTGIGYRPYSDFYQAAFGDFSDNSTSSLSSHKVDLPEIDKDVLKDKISTCGLFYKIGSISVESLKATDGTLIDMPDNTLATLEEQERMKDDYKSHTKMSAKSIFVYNSRLNAANITETLFDGFPIANQHTRVETTIAVVSHVRWTLYTYLKKDGKKYIVRAAPSFMDMDNVLYMYYPDADAYQIDAVMEYVTNDMIKSRVINRYFLTPHALLNGSYYFKSLKGGNGDKFNLDDYQRPTIGTTEYPNKLYTSNVDNAFVFEPSNINTIGIGELQALSSAAKPLSQGQFGQFPLYCFSTDGVWALSVTDSGGWSSKQPISRDVILGKPLQLNSEVAYMSGRGLMILQGGNSECVSDILKGDASLDGIKNLAQMVSLMGQSPIKGLSLPNNPIMAYDNSRSRIFLFGDKDNISWVYSLKSGLWSMTDEYFDSVANSYPNVLLGKGSSIYSLDAENYRVPDKGLILTRPMKYDFMGFKSVSSVITSKIGMDIMSALFATIDYQNCILVKSSVNEKILNIFGSPYRAYSLLLGLSNMTSASSISLTQFMQSQRLTDKLR